MKMVFFPLCIGSCRTKQLNFTPAMSSLCYRCKCVVIKCLNEFW